MKVAWSTASSTGGFLVTGNTQPCHQTVTNSSQPGGNGLTDLLADSGRTGKIFLRWPTSADRRIAFGLLVHTLGEEWINQMLNKSGQAGLYNHFRRTGFARVRDAVSPDQVIRMHDLILRDLKEKRQPFRTDARGKPIRLDTVSRRDPVFIDCLRNPIAVDALTVLLGPNVVLLQNRHNHATLNRRGNIPFRLHRDILQWSRPIVTVIIYVDDAPVERGCTHVVPGSHMERYAGMPPDGGGGNWADDHIEYQHLLDQSLPVPMMSGDMLILDSLAFHSVGTNITSESRISTTFALRSVDELDRATDRHVLLCGNWVYKGNDLDYNTVIPAQNDRQAKSTEID